MKEDCKEGRVKSLRRSGWGSIGPGPFGRAWVDWKCFSRGWYGLLGPRRCLESCRMAGELQGRKGDFGKGGKRKKTIGKFHIFGHCPLQGRCPKRTKRIERVEIGLA